MRHSIEATLSIAECLEEIYSTTIFDREYSSIHELVIVNQTLIMLQIQR